MERIQMSALYTIKYALQKQLPGLQSRIRDNSIPAKHTVNVLDK